MNVDSLSITAPHSHENTDRDVASSCSIQMIINLQEVKNTPTKPFTSAILKIYHLRWKCKF